MSAETATGRLAAKSSSVYERMTRLARQHGAVNLAQDLNLSSHGAEYLRSFVDKCRRESSSLVYAATKVIRPAPTTDPAALREATSRLSGATATHAAISSVPHRWGMIATASTSPKVATERLLKLEQELAFTKLAI